MRVADIKPANAAPDHVTGDGGWKMPALKKSMKAEGMRDPIHVAKMHYDPSGQVYAADGSHRLETARRLGWSHVPVRDGSWLDEDTHPDKVVPGHDEARRVRESLPER
jgi:uncharacterized ParB-like nuclease family protein